MRSFSPQSAARNIGGICAAAVVALAAALAVGLGLHALLAYLLSISAVTFLAYGYDKLAAGRGWLRVPDRVLQGLALAGGTPGAYAGQRVWRHKTRKESFQMQFWLICALQVAAIAGYFVMTGRE